jgi:hypothetical protein
VGGDWRTSPWRGPGMTCGAVDTYRSGVMARWEGAATSPLQSSRTRTHPTTRYSRRGIGGGTGVAASGASWT